MYLKSATTLLPAFLLEKISKKSNFATDRNSVNKLKVNFSVGHISYIKSYQQRRYAHSKLSINLSYLCFDFG